jgi:hypothetical protein
MSAGKEDVERAVSAASAAMKGWKKVTPTERGLLLFRSFRLADLIERDADVLAALESMDNGKSFSDARHIDISSVVTTFRYYAGFADKIFGKVSLFLLFISRSSICHPTNLPTRATNRSVRVHHLIKGICGLIIVCFFLTCASLGTFHF